MVKWFLLEILKSVCGPVSSGKIVDYVPWALFSRHSHYEGGGRIGKVPRPVRSVHIVSAPVSFVFVIYVFHKRDIMERFCEF